MKYLFTYLLLCILQPVMAQEWAPVGAQWTYTYHYGIAMHESPPPPEGLKPAVWTCDTAYLFKDHWCKQISTKDDLYNHLGNPIITYQDDDKVYIYYQMEDTFKLLYDFAARTGDYWPEMHGCPYLINRITSVGTTTINGFTLSEQSREKYDKDDGAYERDKIIRWIGSTREPFPYDRTCVGMPNTYEGLRCYYDPVIGFHDFRITSSCDYKINYTSIPEQQRAVVKIGPNPFTDQLLIDGIEARDAILEIRDLMGKVMLRQVLEPGAGKQSLSTARWPAGVYMYQVLSEGRQVGTGRLFRL